MKRTLLISMPALSLLAALATAQPPSYHIADVGTLPGGTFSLATYVNNNGLVTGVSTVADGTQHAFLWYKGQFTDIAKPGATGSAVSHDHVANATTGVGPAREQAAGDEFWIVRMREERQCAGRCLGQRRACA